RQQPMKDLLMDDRFIVGLRHLYSDEILWTAALRYDRPSDKLTSQDVRRLYRALIETMQDSLKARGTSWGSHAFTDLSGVSGQYQLELKVFEREGEAWAVAQDELDLLAAPGTLVVEGGQPSVVLDRAG
ncbi:MAG: hypothetical protein KY433_12840, partial [Actinobacteria bacterium]|nr:hypothetical protein [Actinomycetota bacterium]